MNRLIEIIAFTPHLGRMRAFYEQGLGIATTFADPHWTSFDTAGVSFALHPLEGGHARGIELTFETRDLDADVSRLQGRGIELGPVHDEPWGRFVSFRDPEGNGIGLRQSASPVREGGGPAIGTVILNCRHLRSTVAFYHEALGLPAAWQNEHWVELGAGEVRLALHLRPAGADHPLHARQSVAWCFDSPELEDWVAQMRGRGLVLATEPTEEDWGLYAEIADPDGNVVVFRTPAAAEPLEEQLALAFDGDAPTHAEGMRKPVRKATGGTSRLALRPTYRAKARSSSAKSVRHRAALEGKRKARASAASPRGTGPAGSRKKPKTRKDAKRPKTKPAIGRKRKAETAAKTRSVQAAAGASKSRRVKKASARPTRGRRR